jgi:hypothetical protein
MELMGARLLPGAGLGLCLVAACGGPTPRSESGLAASAAAVAVNGVVARTGTRGSILLFAYTDLGPKDDPVGHEPTTVSTLAPDGSFDLSIAPSQSLTLVFLADGSNDGVVDEGDPIAVLSAPELADLQAGDRVHVGDADLDFQNRRVTAAVEVARIGEPAVTPTAVP